MATKTPIYGLDADATWEDDPADWRGLPDPDADPDGDDADLPAPEWLKGVLGFDPDDLFPPTGVRNAWCATGKGGGKNNSCGTAGRGSSPNNVVRQAVEQLGLTVKAAYDDPAVRQAARDGWNKAKAVLRGAALEHLTKTAVKAADTWVFDTIVNAAGDAVGLPKTTLTAKAAAWGMAKAYLAARRRLNRRPADSTATTNAFNGDDSMKLQKLLSGLADAAGLPVPTEDECRKRLRRVARLTRNSGRWQRATVRILPPVTDNWCNQYGGTTCKGGRTGPVASRTPKSAAGSAVSSEKGTPAPGVVYKPKVDADRNKDGVTDAARVGVPASAVPPPPPVGRLPNLTLKERRAESAFIRAFEKAPDKVAGDFRVQMHNAKKPGEPPTFGTDDAKLLYSGWNHADPAQRAKNRATLNTPLHQTANAIAKRAFVHELDTLKPGDEVLVTVGGCGCHVADTPLLMYDGSLKMVQDVEVGDELMGPDSTPRRVLRLIEGTGKLHRIVPKKGQSFVVNEDHVLSMHCKRTKGNRGNPVAVNMTVKEFLSQDKSFQTDSFLYRVGVDFEYNPVPLDPYFLGIWLGNGTHSLPQVTTRDEEVAEYMGEFANQFPETELVVREKDSLDGVNPNKAKDYRVALLNKHPGKGVLNPVTQLLKQLGVYKNKHVPQSYLVNDRETRLRLLAGLLDTDGEVDGAGFSFSTKDEVMAYDVAYLARSLGFAAYVHSRWIKTQLIDEPRLYWAVSINGLVTEIPTRVVRKKPRERVINKNPLRVGFTVEPAGDGTYYGFTLEGDGLYLMDDFTVTHNSGKGYALKNVPEALSMKQKSKVVWDSAGDQNATENPWIQREAEKRGLKVNYVYVHADPQEQWAGGRGVVQRANDPSDGRMVDAKVFADS